MQDWSDGPGELEDGDDERRRRSGLLLQEWLRLSICLLQCERSGFPFSSQLLQKQHELITPGASVLDLGCSQGSRLEVSCQSLGPPEKG
ncbi:hypothetical protein ZIOFF_048939 [Zingiber officinale]|uniref:Uncharacterized protein n=1 Tax=Zingiber officinale TaxID=94328 RepID=A0A8J5FQG9_ZINOF|nr:hypothetical protein ZIOFF_048939 [Zingiber officinale]